MHIVTNIRPEIRKSRRFGGRQEYRTGHQSEALQGLHGFGSWIHGCLIGGEMRMLQKHRLSRFQSPPGIASFPFVLFFGVSICYQHRQFGRTLH